MRKDCHQTENSGRQKLKWKRWTKNMTEERNLKTGNTFSVLQEEEQEPILEEEELPPIIKIDKERKNVIERGWRRRLRKHLNEREEVKWYPNQDF